MAERQQVTPNRSARSAKALVSFIASFCGTSMTSMSFKHDQPRSP
jgi:hypothetical protein